MPLTSDALIGFAAGLGVGLLLAVLGAGGSLLIVPVLVFALHTPVSTAAGTSLAIVGAGALVGALGHHRKGNVHPLVAVLFGGASMVGAVGGAWLHGLTSERVLLGLFAAILFVASGRMAWGSHEPSDPGRAARPQVVVPLGLAIGVLSGFLGVGGGFLMVPALTWGASLPLRQAIGTSLVVIALSSTTGVVSHALQGHVSGALLLTVGAGAVLGAVAGAPLQGKLPERPLRLAFAALCFAMGVYVVVKVFIG